jgi:phenylpyruvate tautomerase PptA (4-oxalocrotonate tautomerase family)
MVLVEFRAGRPNEYRLKLADGIVDACSEILGVPRRWVLIEFTPHKGEEIYRDGKWVADWTPDERAPLSAT